MQKQLFKIVIPCSKSFEFINLYDIVRCEGLQNNTRIFLVSGEELISTNNIGTYKKTLPEHGFFCCHKSHIINKEKIKRYHKNGSVELVDNSLVPVSRRKREAFFNYIIDGYNLSAIKQKNVPNV